LSVIANRVTLASLSVYLVSCSECFLHYFTW